MLISMSPCVNFPFTGSLFTHVYKFYTSHVSVSTAARVFNLRVYTDSCRVKKCKEDVWKNPKKYSFCSKRHFKLNFQTCLYIQGKLWRQSYKLNEVVLAVNRHRSHDWIFCHKEYKELNTSLCTAASEGSMTQLPLLCIS